MYKRPRLRPRSSPGTSYRPGRLPGRSPDPGLPESWPAARLRWCSLRFLSWCARLARLSSSTLSCSAIGGLVARFAARKRFISLAAAAGRSACGQVVDCLISVSVELAGSNRGAIAEATTSAVISASPVPDRISTGPVEPSRRGHGGTRCRCPGCLPWWPWRLLSVKRIRFRTRAAEHCSRRGGRPSANPGPRDGRSLEPNHNIFTSVNIRCVLRLSTGCELVFYAPAMTAGLIFP